MISFLLALLPLSVCMVLLIIYRRSLAFSSSIALFITLIIGTMHTPFNFIQPIGAIQSVNIFEGLRHIKHISYASFILCLTLLLVVAPSLAFNQLLKGKQYIQGLVTYLEQINICTEQKILILLLGFVPAFECITGFGICLLLAMPVYSHYYNLQIASRLALLSINMMTWGALTIGIQIGANLSQQMPWVLSKNTASMAIFSYTAIALMALWSLGKPAFKKHAGFAILLGSLLPVWLYIASIYKLDELVGVIAGLTNGFVGLLIAKLQNKFKVQASIHPKTNTHIIKLLLPFLVLIAGLLFTRFYPNLFTWMKSHYVLQAGAIKLALLTSPGLLLILTTALFCYIHQFKLNFKIIFTQIKPMSLGLFSFFCLTQTMLHNHMLLNIANTLSQLPFAGILFVSPLLAMLSGFMTGSTSGANAMMMSIQYNIGINHQQTELITAIQQAGAGHTTFLAFASLFLIQNLCVDYFKQSISINTLLKQGFGIALILYTILVSSAYIWAFLI